MDVFVSVQWDYWLNLATVKLGEAVWLSMDIDPRSARPADTRYIPSEELKRAEHLWAIQAYRIEAAISHAKARNLLLRIDEGDLNGAWILCEVVLIDFRAWGESLPIPFTFPDGFPRAAQSESDSARYIANNESETANPRERASMLRIIRALGVMAKLPERGASASVEWQLQELGFASPKEATIRALLREAAALRSD